MDTITPNEFINLILPGACKIQRTRDLPAASMIAQTCDETAYGREVTKDIYTGQDSKNLFNIKGHGPAGSCRAWTYEYENGEWKKIIAEFRAYSDYSESFNDYADLIINSGIYPDALKNRHNPVEYLKSLQKNGYATNPTYANDIISIMNSFNIVERVNEYMTQQQIPSDWAKEAWEKAVKFKIVDGTFPHDPLTREQLVVILDRLGLLKDISQVCSIGV